ncbi:MAG TPA: hypothetical protein VFF96_09310 [Pseudoxanthomonas sp.]|nr:hypothetical protein [Pseudoxanthomonas sp.]
MSRPQIALFTFTLGNAESIGPAALRELWVRASGTANVDVARRDPHVGRRDRPVYTLYASQGLANLRDVEVRLRQLLEAAHLNASLTSLHA